MQEYWNGLSCPPPGDLPDPGIEPMSLISPALAGRFFTTNATKSWAPREEETEWGGEERRGEERRGEERRGEERRGRRGEEKREDVVGLLNLVKDMTV